MFHFKIKSRHFERVAESASLFPLSNYFFSTPSFSPVSSSYFPPFASFSFIHPEWCTQYWCDAHSNVILSEWLSSMSKDPARKEKQVYGLPRLSKVEAQFSSYWPFQGIWFLNSIKISNSTGGEGGECRGTRRRSTIYEIRKVKRNCQARGLSSNAKKTLTTGVTSRKILQAAG